MMNVFDFTYPFTTPPLSFNFDALEPHIDARTMEIHHDKHHTAYVTKLNAALEPHPKLQTKTRISSRINDTSPDSFTHDRMLPNWRCF